MAHATSAEDRVEIGHAALARGAWEEARASFDVDAIDGLVADVEQALRDCSDDDGVVIPLETYMAVARR